MNNLTDEEKDGLAGMQYFQDWDSGYAIEQSTRPQTVGYGLADSPAESAPNLCSALPRLWWRFGTDSVSLGARFGPDHRFILAASRGFDRLSMIESVSSRLLKPGRGFGKGCRPSAK